MARGRRTRPTIVEVARAAGVAVSTASDALNDKGRVSAATRERVATVAAELEFQPHRSARGLPSRRAMAIGVRFGSDAAIPAGSFFVEMLESAAKTAAENGYGLLISSPSLNESEFVDGLIVVDPVNDNDIRGPLELGLPVVTIGPNRVPESPYLDVDHAAALPILLDHLSSRAPAGPVWFVSMPNPVPFMRELQDAFDAWCQRHCRIRRILRSPDDPVPAAEATRTALEEGEPPSIVVTVRDRQAAGVHRAFAGVDARPMIGSASDGDLLVLLDPPVSAIALGGSEHGRASIAMVLDWLKTDERPENRLLPAHLIKR